MKTGRCAFFIVTLLNWCGPTSAFQSAELATQDCPGWWYGQSVAAYGNVAVVASPRSFQDGANTGLAYVFRFDGTSWVQEQVLKPSGVGGEGEIGGGVAVFQDTAAVSLAYMFGTPNQRGGEVYVFQFEGGTWNEKAKLVPTHSAVGDFFGRKIVLEGGLMLVLAGTGRVHPFRKEGDDWIEEPAITSAEIPSGYIIEDVAISGGMMVIGVMGSANVFRRHDGRWRLEHVLNRPGIPWKFGPSVAIDAQTVVVGSETNRAYIFQYAEGRWTGIAEFQGDDYGDNFGLSVAVKGDLIAVGARKKHVEGIRAGAVHFYRRCHEGWKRMGSVGSPIASPRAGFGSTIAIAQSNVLVAAPEMPTECPWYRSNGMVYAVEPAIADCNLNGQSDELDLASGQSPDCNHNCMPDECEMPPLCPFCVDCNENGRPDACDARDSSLDCNDSDIPDECEVPPRCQDCLDCNANGVPDRCDTDGGASADCNENSVPDECEVPPLCTTCPDCNANGIPDRCDVRSEASDDCNQNDIPDECELDELCSGCTDCNVNRIPDECDLYYGHSDDCNGNLIPDECDPDCDGDGQADTCVRNFTLRSTSRKPDHEFGWSMDSHGDLAIFGAPKEQPQGSGSSWRSSAYIYRRSGTTWLPEQVITPDETELLYGFGDSVAICGEWAAVGASRAPNGNLAVAGAVLVYRFGEGGWTLDTTLRLNGATGHTLFGHSISLRDGVLAIGAPGQSPAPLLGRAFVYRWNGVAWHLEQELLPWLPASTRRFGLSVSVSGELCLVGAPSSSGADSQAGAAYAFHYRGGAWHPLQYLQPDDHVPFGRFGGKVTVSGPHALIVALAPSTTYFYSFNGVEWEFQTQTAMLPGARDSHLFATTLDSLAGEFAAIGAAEEFGGSSSRVGRVYLFRKVGSVWHEARLLEAGPAWRFEYFGRSVGLAAGSLLVGAPGGDDFGDIRPRDWQSGAVFGFPLEFVVGDTDFDGLRTHSDFRRLSICLTQTEALPTGETRFACVATFDFDHDEDVDLADVAAFQREFGCPD